MAKLCNYQFIVLTVLSIMAETFEGKWA